MNKKIKVTQTIATEQYENLKFEYEIEVPDGLRDKELTRYLEKEYKHIFNPSAEIRENQERIIYNVGKGIVESIEDYQEFIEPYPEVRERMNDEKKKWKRSDDYKGRVEKRNQKND